MSAAVTSRRSGSGSRSQAGFTLVELLVALGIGALIVAAVASALMLSWRLVGKTTDDVTSSRSAFQTNARFARDIANGATTDGSNAIGRGKPGCGGDATSVLRIVRADAAKVTVVSYSAAGGALERRTCEGPDLAGALAAPTRSTSSKVVPNLATAPDATSVVCRESVDGPEQPVNDAGDAGCNFVSLTVRTGTGFVFTVDGERDAKLAAPPPVTTTLKRCTLVASMDTWVSSYAGDQLSGPDVHLNVFTRWNGSLVSFIKMDLLGPCTGPDEPSNLPGGKRLMSADLQLWMLRWGPSWECTNPTTHRVRVLSQHPWDDPNAILHWDEVNVTWNTRPEPKPEAPDTFTTFEAVNDVGLYSVPVLSTVQKWYAYTGSPDGDWYNNGWQIDRSGIGACDSEKDGGWWWGSRENPDPKVWPRLVVTWQ